MTAQEFLNLPESVQNSQLEYGTALGLLSMNSVTNRGYSHKLGYNPLEFVDAETRQATIAKVHEKYKFSSSVTIEELSKVADLKVEKLWHHKNYVDNTHGKKLTNMPNRYWLQVFEEAHPSLDFGSYLIFRTVQNVLLHNTTFTMNGKKEKTKEVKDCIFVIPKIYTEIAPEKFHPRKGINGGVAIQGIWEFYMPSDNLATTLNCDATGVFILVGYCENQDSAYPNTLFEGLSLIPDSAETQVFTQ
jgi:hypothetical protein